MGIFKLIFRWVNRKDASGKNLFEGGFMGLDNIGVFDRSNVDDGFSLQQADSTAWMVNDINSFN